MTEYMRAYTAPGLGGTYQRNDSINSDYRSLYNQYSGYWSNYADEVKDYWDTYTRRTGYSPRYPYMAGKNNTFGYQSTASALQAQSYSLQNEYLFYKALKQFVKAYSGDW